MILKVTGSNPVIHPFLTIKMIYSHLLSLIIVIIGSVYFRYFDTKKTFDNEVNQTEINNTKQLTNVVI